MKHLYPDDFEAFWAAYPHHGSRSIKRDSFTRWKNMTTSDQCAANEGVEKYREALRQEEFRTAKGCQVWLNQRGWESEEERCEREAKVKVALDTYRRRQEQQQTPDFTPLTEEERHINRLACALLKIELRSEYRLFRDQDHWRTWAERLARKGYEPETLPGDTFKRIREFEEAGVRPGS